MKHILRLIKRIAASRFGQLLFIIHLCLVVYEFAQKPAAIVREPCFIEPTADGIVWAGRSFVFHSESALLKIIAILDYPALFLSNLIRSPLFLSNLCPYTQTWIYAVISLIVTSIQWWVIGFLLSKIIRRFRDSKGAASI